MLLCGLLWDVRWHLTFSERLHLFPVVCYTEPRRITPYAYPLLSTYMNFSFVRQTGVTIAAGGIALSEGDESFFHPNLVRS